ncbi:hypothetical protein KJZ99_00020 [bacterium]|nr:hypothetical protein [bacterium]
MTKVGVPLVFRSRFVWLVGSGFEECSLTVRADGGGVDQQIAALWAGGFGMGKQRDEEEVCRRAQTEEEERAKG